MNCCTAEESYDANIFERERLYGIAVHKSRHPELNLYISDSILSIKACSLPLKSLHLINIDLFHSLSTHFL